MGNLAALLTGKIYIALGALEKLRLQAFKNERYIMRAFLYQPHGNQPCGTISSDSQGAKIHGTQMVSGPPSQRNFQDHSIIRHFNDGRFYKKQ